MWSRQRDFWLITTSLVVSVLLFGGCTAERSNSGKRGVASLTPYLPDEELAAPGAPPPFLVATPGKPSLKPFYFDWSGAGGSTKAPPTRMRWQALTQNLATLGWLETSQVPIRVVIYLYPQVGANGVPTEESGSEYPCASPGSQQALCTYHKVIRSGNPVIELTTHGRLDINACYVVVNAGWIVRHYRAARETTVNHNISRDEVAASWAWHRCAG